MATRYCIYYIGYPYVVTISPFTNEVGEGVIEHPELPEPAVTEHDPTEIPFLIK